MQLPKLQIDEDFPVWTKSHFIYGPATKR